MEVLLQPKTLFDLATNSYEERIITFCNDAVSSQTKNKLHDDKEYCKHLQDEICSLPVLVADIVTNKIMKHIQGYRPPGRKLLGPAARTMALNLILHPKMQNLYITNINNHPCRRSGVLYLRLFYKQLHTLNNLKIIRIQCFAEFDDQVKFPVNLVEFSIPNCIISDAALENLAISCPKLKHLNINNCVGITSNSINSISKCIHLETLCLAFVNILDDEFMELLKLLKKNEQDSIENKVPTLKGLQYGYFNSDHLHYISDNFPVLERLHMSYSEQSDVKFFSTISQIKQIGISINSPDGILGFKNLPQSLNSKLVDLHITCPVSMFTGIEIHSWPQLKSLSLNFECSQFSYPLNCLKYESPSQFPAIENLEICMLEYQSDTYQIFHYLISKCINLKRVCFKFGESRIYRERMYTLLMELLDDKKTKEVKNLEVIRISPRPIGDHNILAKKLISVFPKLRVVVGLGPSNLKYQSVLFIDIIDRCPILCSSETVHFTS